MTQIQMIDGKSNNIKYGRMYIGFELSNSKWKLSFGNGSKIRMKTIAARDISGLEKEIEIARQKLKIAEDAEICSCYEAGRDGFWIHRQLEALGIKNLVIDPASIDTKRRARNAKTDRIDAEKLLSCLIRYLNGEKRTFAVVHVPSAEEEDIRRVNREIKRLQKERTSHTNRIKSLLVLCGIIQEIGIGFLNDLELLRQWDGNPVPPNIKAEIIREYRRYELVKKHVEELEGKKKEILKSLGNGADKALRLEQLKGVGPVSAWLMTFEFFGWREFKNVKQVGAAAGLTPTPHNSGDMVREQGISKSGNKRIRAAMIELSWLWLRYQPESRITIWFNERFATAGKRMRRIGIVAVARKLLVALWKYLEKGMIPEGSILKANA